MSLCLYYLQYRKVTFQKSKQLKSKKSTCSAILSAFCHLRDVLGPDVYAAYPELFTVNSVTLLVFATNIIA